MILFQNLKNQKIIRNAIANGAEKENQKDYEGAYEQYLRAAELGSSDAMVRIATMYCFKSFRPVEKDNLAELFLQGIPAFPWNIATRKVPDDATGFDWYRKAAEQNHPIACCMAGSMLCEGRGCKMDQEAGLAYLQKAADAGIQEARNGICIYQENSGVSFTREEYEALLSRFAQAAEAGKDEAYTLYYRLKGAEEHFLSRLGYVITTAKNSNRQGYAPFRYFSKPSGIPLIPACARRAAWKSLVRIDLDAFPSEDVLIAISSDIDAESILGYTHRLRKAGQAVYRSPEFGWLREEKQAVLFRMDQSAALTGKTLENMIQDFGLREEEYAPENAAFLTEYGEKEYSVEIAAILENRVDVLFRYTIGGSDRVNDYFEPELMSLTLETEKAEP